MLFRPFLTASRALLRDFFSLSKVNLFVDGKAKKRWDVIQQKIKTLRQQLAGARKQDDEPGEVRRYEQEIAALEAEAAKLKA